MWLVYVLLACLGLGAGAAMQKHGMATRLPELSMGTLVRDLGRVVRTVARSPVWVLGGALNLAGAGCLVLAIDAGELSVVQPLTNLNLVVSVLAGVVILRERLSTGERIGVLSLVAGGVLLSLSGLRGAAPPSALPTAVLLWAGGACLAAVLGLQLAGQLRAARVGPELVLGLSSGLLYGLGIVCLKGLTSQLHGLSPGAAAWTAVASLPLWGVLAANAAGYAFEQLAFSHGRVAVVDPLCTGGGGLVPVAVGAVALAERIDALRAAGLVVLGSGLALLLWRRATRTGQAARP